MFLISGLCTSNSMARKAALNSRASSSPKGPNKFDYTSLLGVEEIERFFELDKLLFTHFWLASIREEERNYLATLRM